MDNIKYGMCNVDTLTVLDADPIAGDSLHPRFAVARSDSNSEMAVLDILVPRKSAHNVTKLFLEKEVKWALAFDDNYENFVVVECVGTVSTMDQICGALRALSFSERKPYDRRLADGMRHLHIPE